MSRTLSDEGVLFLPLWNVHFTLAVDSARPSLIRSLAEIRAFAGVIQGIPLPPYVESRLHALNIMRAVVGRQA